MVISQLIETNEPPVITQELLEDCFFYHTTELPGWGLIRGEWDLRFGVNDYLGHVPLNGKRVLELGTASGFICFEMEKQGALVTACDLGIDDRWDAVPYGGKVSTEVTNERKRTIQRLQNAWQLAHRLNHSCAQVIYCSAYDVPASAGPFDVATFGSILLHLRDPFLALQKAAALTGETLIVTEAVPVFHRSRILAPLRWLARLSPKYATYLIPSLDFLPDPDMGYPNDTWWNLSPEIIRRFVKILGFPHVRLTYHNQIHHYGEGLEKTRLRKMFTIVARRKN